jgi:hypothetical protein
VENFNYVGSNLNADKMNIEIAERIAKGGNKAYYNNAKLIK